MVFISYREKYRKQNHVEEEMSGYNRELESGIKKAGIFCEYINAEDVAGLPDIRGFEDRYHRPDKDKTGM